jgi:teichuronic acid biosynthesis glycosyltransferase TuaC
MKVLVISHMYPSTFSEVSGIFVHEQVKALVGKGLEVRVISPVPWTPFPINYLSPKWKAYSRVPLYAIQEGIPVFHPRYIALPRALFFASSGDRMYRGIRNLVSELYRGFPFDLIHAHEVLPDGYAGLLLSKKFNCPLVVTLHGSPDIYKAAQLSTNRRRKVLQTLRGADAVITVSSQLKRAAEEWYLCGSKIRVVNNGFSLSRVGPRKPPLSSKMIFLLTVGNLVERKGHRYVLLALSQLAKKYREVKLLMVGDGPERSRLAELINRLGLQNRVDLLGVITGEKLAELYALCDVFVLPSWEEAFGIVYLEAMANGKPVIGCLGEGIEDFVEHKRTGWLVKPRDVDSLVEALDYLLSNPQEARAIGERARQVALQYTWERNAERTIEVYKEVLR